MLAPKLPNMYYVHSVTQPQLSVVQNPLRTSWYVVNPSIYGVHPFHVALSIRRIADSQKFSGCHDNQTGSGEILGLWSPLVPSPQSNSRPAVFEATPRTGSEHLGGGCFAAGSATLRRRQLR